jgi:hypothetical protein
MCNSSGSLAKFTAIRPASFFVNSFGRRYGSLILMADSPNIAYLKKYVRCAKWAGIPVYKMVVETGTYRGNGAVFLAGLFPIVHTIELSERWHEFSSRRLAGCKNIVCHHGDSAEVLERLLPSICYAATFFLDAHFAGGDTAFGREEVPLLRELEVLSRRSYPDLILVDDLRCIGRTGESGSTSSDEYPPMRFDWGNVTLDRIAGVFNLDNRTLWIFEDDRIVIFRNLSRSQAVLLKTLLCLYSNSTKNTARIVRLARHVARRAAKFL